MSFDYEPRRPHRENFKAKIDFFYWHGFFILKNTYKNVYFGIEQKIFHSSIIIKTELEISIICDPVPNAAS